ncbi:MAG TPA: hypothetical protein ENK91_03750, partial [Bacteroidetes bacterium]|nr:hypothetical protein [Bacteroidota bacterium]
NANNLTEAADLINNALQDSTMAADRKVWIVKAKIFNELANNDLKTKILKPETKFTHPNAAIDAFEALVQAYNKSEKSRYKKEVLKLLKETENHLNNFAAYEFQDKNYAAAFENFKRTCKAYHMFKDAGQEEDSRLADPQLRKEQKLYTGYAAYYADKKDEAEHFFKDLADAGTDQPFVYEALFNIYQEQGKKEEALKYLDEGRKAFPDDTGLLFAEINYYIKEGKLDVLTDKLKKAIELDPENVTVYTTLGSVYDQLHTKAFESGDTAKTKEYFDLAMKYFNKATDIDSTNFNAIYSIGALYYNSAANYTKEINKYANDFSAEGTKKYDELKAKMLGLFGQALPYFEKAYSLNNNDLGVLQALSEIYARKDMLDKAKEFRDKLNAAKAAQGK